MYFDYKTIAIILLILLLTGNIYAQHTLEKELTACKFNVTTSGTVTGDMGRITGKIGE